MHSDAILQTYLDRVAVAIMANDWPSYADAVSLPFDLVTGGTSISVTTSDDLRVGFQSFVQTLRTQQVTDYIRIVISSTYVSDDEITGSYDSHFTSHSYRILPPFTSHISLRLVDQTWRATSISNPLANARWPLLLPRTISDPDNRLS